MTEPFAGSSKEGTVVVLAVDNRQESYPLWPTIVLGRESRRREKALMGSRDIASLVKSSDTYPDLLVSKTKQICPTPL